MFDYRLKIFAAVADRLSFTKAADELNITQPAVSKHIREMENELKTKLFNRNGKKIELTESGKILFRYSEKIRNISRDFNYELNLLQNLKKGKLKIGASTTIANYILPKILAEFNTYHNNIEIEVIVDNTEKISKLLEKSKIDCALTEGKTQSNLLEYDAFLKDEIILVTSTDNKIGQSKLALQDLYHLDFVRREKGSGSREVIKDALAKSEIRYDDFHTVIELGSSEAIKNYLLNSHAFAFLSVNNVYQELKHNAVRIIDLDDFSIPRDLYFVTQKGSQSAIVNLFKKMVMHNQ